MKWWKNIALAGLQFEIKERIMMKKIIIIVTIKSQKVEITR